MQRRQNLLVESQTLSPIQRCSVDDQIKLLEAADEYVVIDTEGWNKMLGFSLCFRGIEDGFYIPFNHVRGNINELQRIKLFQILHTKVLIMHNAVYDLRVLKRN